ncbi:MarR family transcriptional regulator [Streptomyces niveus]|uniref:MarR family transcriptional regulator n=1 Tax=Streptomyces niveus TaxID=193462 RepID=UPI003640FC36
MLMDTGLLAMLRRLKLTPTATDVLSVMVEKQEPGGHVIMTQPEMAKELDIHPSRVSRAMALLVDRGLVIRPNNGRGRSYALNPTVAGYESESHLADEMTKQLALGGPPPIMVPKYQQPPPKPGQGHLSVAS